jgi:hypothetical protein
VKLKTCAFVPQSHIKVINRTPLTADAHAEPILNSVVRGYLILATAAVSSLRSRSWPAEYTRSQPGQIWNSAPFLAAVDRGPLLGYGSGMDPERVYSPRDAGQVDPLFPRWSLA